MAFQRALRPELSNSTCIVIAHRLFTIADFDNIFVLDQGNICESGSPAALFKAQGAFWDLVCQSSEREAIETMINVLNH